MWTQTSTKSYIRVTRYQSIHTPAHVYARTHDIQTHTHTHTHTHAHAAGVELLKSGSGCVGVAAAAAAKALLKSGGKVTAISGGKVTEAKEDGAQAAALEGRTRTSESK